ncbi:MAG TPA: hypothetical protein VGN76_09095 [Gemmatimonadales bacterium]|nr:hypothetical protein [Gemmatimonadales bacterium]
MSDQLPALTRANIREEAREILSAIDTSRSHQAPFQANWRRVWQLVREAKAASVWHLSGDPDDGHGVLAHLTAGSFLVSIRPLDQAGLGANLPGLLNWAGVSEPAA